MAKLVRLFSLVLTIYGSLFSPVFGENSDDSLARAEIIRLKQQYESAYEKGDPRGALSTVNAILKLNSGDRATIILRADLLRVHFWDYAGAVAAYNRAFVIAQPMADELRHRAECYMNLGKYSKAITDLRRASVLEPKSWRIPHEYAVVLKKMNRTSEAWALERKSLDLKRKYSPEDGDLSGNELKFLQY